MHVLHFCTGSDITLQHQSSHFSVEVFYTQHKLSSAKIICKESDHLEA